MELKPGYKQTEVGVIPEDWEVVMLGNMGVFSKGCGIRKNEATSGYIPCVRYGEIYTYHDDIIRDFNSRISIEIAKTSRRLKKGDLLFAGSGETKDEIGKCVAFVDDIEAYAGGDIVILSPNKVVPHFLGYLFNAPVVARQKASKGQGDAVVHISARALSTIKVALPSTTSEQTAIANALSDADALIQSLTRLIAKKRQIKQGTMQTLLTGKKRLPMFVKSMNYQNTDIGIIPEDWDCVAMGDIGQSLIGLTYNPSNVKDYGTLVLRSSNVQGGQLAFENNVFVDMELPKRVMVEPDDILICVRNGSRQLIGKCALIDDRVKGAAFGAFMSVYRSKYSRFIFYQFQSHIIQKQIEEVMGATINQITNKDLSVFKIALPKSEEELTCIATILSGMDAEIAALEAKLAKYRHIKQGMMQNLLSGRIRLVQPDSNAGAAA